MTDTESNLLDYVKLLSIKQHFCSKRCNVPLKRIEENTLDNMVAMIETHKDKWITYLQMVLASS